MRSFFYGTQILQIVMMSKDLLICVYQPNLCYQRSIIKFVYLIYAKH
jgi:hypothetical protein